MFSGPFLVFGRVTASTITESRIPCFWLRSGKVKRPAAPSVCFHTTWLTTCADGEGGARVELRRQRRWRSPKCATVAWKMAPWGADGWRRTLHCFCLVSSMLCGQIPSVMSLCKPALGVVLDMHAPQKLRAEVASCILCMVEHVLPGRFLFNKPTPHAPHH